MIEERDAGRWLVFFGLLAFVAFFPLAAQFKFRQQGSSPQITQEEVAVIRMAVQAFRLMEKSCQESVQGFPKSWPERVQQVCAPMIHAISMAYQLGVPDETFYMHRLSALFAIFYSWFFSGRSQRFHQYCRHLSWFVETF